MSGKRRGWSDATPLLGQQQPSQNRSYSFPKRSSAPLSVSLEMASKALSSSPSCPLRSVFLGVDVGTGSARAGLSTFGFFFFLFFYSFEDLIDTLTCSDDSWFVFMWIQIDHEMIKMGLFFALTLNNLHELILAFISFACLSLSQLDGFLRSIAVTLIRTSRVG